MIIYIISSYINTRYPIYDLSIPFETHPLHLNPFQSPTARNARDHTYVHEAFAKKKRKRKRERKGAADPKEGTLNDYSSLLNCLYFHSSRPAPRVSRCSHRHSVSESIVTPLVNYSEANSAESSLTGTDISLSIDTDSRVLK